MGRALAATIAGMGSGLVAVASTDQPRGAAFAEEFGIRAIYESAGALATAGEVDAVYIASTNDRHHGDVLACLRAGKAVLCEKPFALTLGQAEEMVEDARRLGVFLMEAMWMRFQPGISLLLDLLEGGRIGEVSLIHAGFGIRADEDPGRRWFSRELGGGSMYDLGVYPLALAHLLLGRPQRVESLSVRAASGVDAQTGVLLGYDGGEMAVLWSSLVADASVEAVISGTEGRIVLHAPFHHTGRLSVWQRGEMVGEHEVEQVGYRTEVEEVERCLASGLGESALWSLDDTLAVAGLVERVVGEEQATGMGSTSSD